MITSTLQASLTANFRLSRLILAITLFGFLTLPVHAQRMPREDVVDVPAIGWSTLRAGPGPPESPAMRRRVRAARARARRRFGHGSSSNAHLSPREIRDHCSLDGAADSMLRRGSSTFGFSARACHRILRVSRTIADLDASARIQSGHVAEALQFRVREPSE